MLVRPLDEEVIGEDDGEKSRDEEGVVENGGKKRRKVEYAFVEIPKRSRESNSVIDESSQGSGHKKAKSDKAESAPECSGEVGEDS